MIDACSFPTDNDDGFPSDNYMGEEGEGDPLAKCYQLRGGWLREVMLSIRSKEQA